MVSSTIFKVFGMTRPGIEPRSPGPLPNTLTAGPMSRNNVKWLKVVLFITNNSIKRQSFVYTQLNDETVLFQTIQFCVSHFLAKAVKISNSSIWSIDWTLPGDTTPGQSRLQSEGNEGVLHILQSSSITRASTSDCLFDVISGTLIERSLIFLQRFSW